MADHLDDIVIIDAPEFDDLDNDLLDKKKREGKKTVKGEKIRTVERIGKYACACGSDTCIGARVVTVKLSSLFSIHDTCIYARTTQVITKRREFLFKIQTFVGNQQFHVLAHCTATDYIIEISGDRFAVVPRSNSKLIRINSGEIVFRLIFNLDVSNHIALVQETQ